MKIIIAIILVSLLTQSLCIKLQDTPKAIGLRNHFGAGTVDSPYGPKTDNVAQYVEANPETFTPMKYAKGNAQIIDAIKFRKELSPGYETALVPHVIKAGDFTNMAPSASTIITPETTGTIIYINIEVQNLKFLLILLTLLLLKNQYSLE